MIGFLQQPWPWYVSGPLIGLIVPALLVLGNKSFGISSSLRHICAACLPAGIPFFQYNWKAQSWNLAFAGGIVIGGCIASMFLNGNADVAISAATRTDLSAMGIHDFRGLLPVQLFGASAVASLHGLIFSVAGGFLVGFGTRYAGGCTSGHAIMGISALQWPSLVATCCFMAGGYFTSWFILPYLIR